MTRDESIRPSPGSPILDHRRQWRECLYVYPVVSRRSKGLSIGVNLNIDKSCTFSCVYCQINRCHVRQGYAVDLTILHDELHLALEEALSGRLWNEARFAATPAALRRLNDIAFSGDGEPTCVPVFDGAVATAAAALRDVGEQFSPSSVRDVKLVVITNASALQTDQVRRALPFLDGCNGEIWAKLDAGTEEMFQRLNRPAPPLTLAAIVDNILSVARDRAVVIQSLFLKLDGRGPSSGDVGAYCDRVKEILAGGGCIKLIQAHTIARPPVHAAAAALSGDQLDAVARAIRTALPGVAVDVFYGADVPPQPR